MTRRTRASHHLQLMPNVRPDRIATLFFFHPLRRLLGRKSTGIPILMYHSISNNAERCRNPYFHTCTAPRVFREHLSLLARNGYQTIGLAEAVRQLETGASAAQNEVVLTFDDGYADFHAEAFPILAQFGFTATVFLPTAYIGDTPREFSRTTCLTWTQVRELAKAGVEFGSHTVTHPQLRDLPPGEIRRELRDSKREMEDRLGDAVDSFSYPYKFPEPDRTFRTMLRETLVEAGYQNGVTTILGTADSASDRLFLGRLPVNSSDDEALLTAKLQGGYEWLHAAQLASKLAATRMAS